MGIFAASSKFLLNKLVTLLFFSGCLKVSNMINWLMMFQGAAVNHFLIVKKWLRIFATSSESTCPAFIMDAERVSNMINWSMMVVVYIIYSFFALCWEIYPSHISKLISNGSEIIIYVTPMAVEYVVDANHASGVPNSNVATIGYLLRCT